MDEERYQQLVRATGSLQEWLSPLTFADLSRSAATSLIAEHAMAWTRWHGFVVRTEVEAIASRLRPRDHRIGPLAIAGEHPAGRQLAIEIDRSTGSGRSRNSLLKPTPASSPSGSSGEHP